jgi:cytochrome c553
VAGTGTGGTSDTAVTAAVTATIAATSCRNPLTSVAGRGGSLAAAALSAVCDALHERRLVGTNVPDISTLAGARSGTIGAALRTWKQKFELQPLKTQTTEG